MHGLLLMVTVSFNCSKSLDYYAVSFNHSKSVDLLRRNLVYNISLSHCFEGHAEMI
jgi:hypothetical protein